MELILFVGGIFAIYFAYGAGVKEGVQQALRKIENAAHEGMNPSSAFASTYRRPGFYFHHLHPDLNVGPLAVLSSAQFLRLVARERLGDESTEEALDKEIERLADAFFIRNGGTPEDLKSLKELSAEIYGKE